MQFGQPPSSGLRATLTEMGYPKKMISLAFKDSKIHTLENILDLLISKEAEYKAILAEPKPLKVVPNPDNVESNPNKRKNSSKQEEKQKKQENKNASSRNKKDKANEQVDEDNQDQSSSEENSYGDEDEESEIPKYMDEESLDYTQSMIQSLKKIRTAKDSTWFLVELSDQLKSLQFKTNEGATKVRNYMDVPRQYPRLEDYKKAVYLIIAKILNSKVNKKYRMNFEELENVLTLAFELRMLRARQMENVITLYPKLCARHMYKPNEEMMTTLEKIHQEVKSRQKDDQDEVLPEEEPEEEKAEEKIEEPANGEDNTESDAQIFIPTSDQEKEYCIICVQKVREIVFMPCCHFLTCLLCSSKIGKCPVCNTKVHKHLQIFWS